MNVSQFSGIQDDGKPKSWLKIKKKSINCRALSTKWNWLVHHNTINKSPNVKQTAQQKNSLLSLLCVSVSVWRLGEPLTAEAWGSSAASAPAACPGSWCQSWRWATPGCQWRKSSPTCRPECSSCSSGRPCPRSTSPELQSAHGRDVEGLDTSVYTTTTIIIHLSIQHHSKHSYKVVYYKINNTKTQEIWKGLEELDAYKV